MWYADALSFKRRDFAITGLIYQAFPMGAVPIGHDSIINLKGVPCEEVDIGETTGYHFALNEQAEYPSLSNDDKDILDFVIKALGGMKKNEIVSFMHKEQAYKKTPQREVIQFQYAKNLQI